MSRYEKYGYVFGSHYKLYGSDQTDIFQMCLLYYLQTVDDTPALYEVIDVTKDETTLMEKHELLKLMAGIETVR